MHWFADSPLLTLFFCVGVGSLFGRIRFGPISFGPAGALFAALALSAIEPDVALPPLVTSLSLCVFCYMVGIAAGPAFVSALRTGWQPVVVSLLAVTAMAGAALGVGKAFGFDIGTIAGAFSGAGTATAASKTSARRPQCRRCPRMPNVRGRALPNRAAKSRGLGS